MLIFLLLQLTFQQCSDSNCSSCPNDMTVCLQCNLPYRLQMSNCVLQCQDGYYPDTTNQLAQCLKCHTTCTICYDGAPNSCKQCTAPLILNCNQCVPETQIQNVCQDCNTKCATCFGPSSSQCYKCAIPYFFTFALNSCTLTCPIPYFGVLSTQICQTVCPDSTYGSPISRLCVTSCPDPYYSDQSSGSCVLLCPTKTYLYQRSCQVCDVSCQTCTGSLPSQCITCSQGYYLYKGFCGQCPAAFYSNNQIRQCVDYLTYQLTVLSQDNSQSKLVFEIQFSQQINQTTLNINNQISVQNISPFYYNLFLNEISLYQSYTVTIVFIISHRQTNLVVNFNNSVSSLIGTPVQNKTSVQSISIPLQFIELQDQQQTQNINYIMIISYLSFYVILYLICLVLKTQKRIFFLIVYVLQTIQLMIFINFTFNNQIQDSLISLQAINFQINPAFGISRSGTYLDFFNSQISYQTPDNNIYLVAGYYYSFIANGGLWYMGLLFIVWMVWLLCFIMHNLYQIRNKQEKIKLFKTLHSICNDVVVRMHEVLYYQFLIIIVLQLWGYNFDSRINIASFSMAIFTATYYIIYLRSVYYSQFDDNQDENIYATFFEDFSKKQFSLINYGFKTTYVLILILLDDYQYIQYSLAFFNWFLYLIFFIMKRPYKKSEMNTLQVLIWLLVFGIFINLILNQVKQVELSSSIILTNDQLNEIYKYGLGFIITLQIILGIYALVFAWSKIQDFIKFLQSKPEWCGKFLENLEKQVFSDKPAVELELEEHNSQM
ncbi:hypothetical protein pb186bvf_016258 [Paramecium bursaria]